MDSWPLLSNRLFIVLQYYERTVLLSTRLFSKIRTALPDLSLANGVLFNLYLWKKKSAC